MGNRVGIDYGGYRSGESNGVRAGEIGTTIMEQQ